VKSPKKGTFQVIAFRQLHYEHRRFRIMGTKKSSIAMKFSLLVLSVLLLFPVVVIADPPDPDGESELGIPVSAEANSTMLAYTGCGGVTAPVIRADYEQEVVDLVNAERATLGLPPLKRVAQLDEAARYFATDMGQDNYFLSDHDTYDRSGGVLIKVCSWSVRIQSYYSEWQRLAENIARGQPTPQEVVQAWMNSGGHRNNILSTESWEIGVGYFYSGGWRYWVQDFGRRRGVYPVVINRDAATTDSANVSLFVYGQGTWSEMRLRNDDGSWTGWMPLQSSLDWTLSSEGGSHTVWVEMRNGSGTTISSDTILLAFPMVPVLGNLPDEADFRYSIPDRRLVPASLQITPMNTGNDEPLAWQVTSMGGWFTVSPTTGNTPASFLITPDNFIADTRAIYTGHVTVTVTDPSGVNGSPHEIDLSLEVVDASFGTVFLPLVVND
jgi:uncharacterized protein YkwD